ncbi:hypothetical protein IWW48_000112 [Coemansia sp. RSA 1200]|nr:hypothetical protein IWW48_000112 [Coemansia sp. RSA 1200]
MNAMSMSPPASKRQQQQQSQKMLLNPFGPPSEPSYVEENAKDRRGGNRNYSTDDNHPVVAFVSGIAALVDDEWVKKILDACGKIVTWKRAYDSDERPQSFGFCEFQTMSDAVRAVRVLASAGEAQKRTTEFRRLSITVDVSVQSDLDTQLSMLELQDDAKDDNPTQVALELVKNIFSELEESVDKKKKDSNVAKPEKEDDRSHGASDDDEEITESKQKDIVDIRSGSGSADHKDKAKGATYNSGEHEDGSEAEDSKTPFSLEEEEAWEKEKIQQIRYKRYVVGAEEREQRMAKEQAEREDRLERSAMRELDRIEERQRARDSMAGMLLRWDDKEEKSSREHEYYRDRERWWRHRKAARARELELDDADRRREEREMELVEKEKQVVSEPQHTKISTGGVDKESETAMKGEPQTTEPTDRREKIEALIKEIPTDMNELFAWPLKWNFVDEHVLATKIEPAVTKRLIEYLGSDADDGSVEELAGFIVSHIRDHNTPSSLAEELEMVLVEEASVFVARIWRVIVYESEARARGLV